MCQQLKDGRIMVARQIATSYFLQICMSQPIEQLSVALKDLQDHVVYKKVYTSQDYGKQISHQVTLKDIFGGLSLSLSTNDLCALITDKKPQDLMVYHFGDKIKNRIGDDCYKIQKNGQITVYVPIQKLDNDSKVVYAESKLNLIKMKEMNEREIINEEMQKGQKLIIEEILEKVKKLQRQNKLLKNQLAQQKQLLSTQLSSQFQSFCRLHILNVSNLFKIKGSKLQKIGIDQSNSTYMIMQSIPFEQVYTFKIKIIKSSHINIKIAIIWYQQEGDASTQYNGFFKSCQDLGLGVNDMVQTKIERQRGKIQFVINGTRKIQESYNQLENQYISFYPSVMMYNTGDIVEFC